MSRFRPIILEIRGLPTGSDPHPKGLRKKTGRTSLLMDQTRLTWQLAPSGPSIRPTRNVCRSLRAILPPFDLGTTQAGRYRIDRSHAGFPQGSFDATNLLLISSRFG